MLKFLPVLVLLGVLACTCALPLAQAEEKEVVPILRSEINKVANGGYDLNVQTGDGTERREEATIEDDALEVKGSYKYIDTDGQEVEVFYTAGRNGFVPYGSTINEKISEVAESAKYLPRGEEDFVVKD